MIGRIFRVFRPGRFARPFSAAVLALLAAPPVLAEAPQKLVELQRQVRQVVQKATRATVGVMNRGAAGSGVIVTPEGHVLTAAHVMANAKRPVTLILSDGQRLEAQPLGANRTRDAAVLKITQKGPWPYCSMGRSSELEVGQWVVALGHPGGYEPGRSPPVRLGRIEVRQDGPFGLVSDCTLIGGDSGGPLFNLRGEVVGIHSSIGAQTTQNRHVPVDVFRRDWKVLLEGRRWGRLAQFRIPPGAGYLGVEVEALPSGDGVRVLEVESASAAAKGGIQVGDVLVRFDGYVLENGFSLAESVAARRAGDAVELSVRRKGKTETRKVTLGGRS